MDKKGYKKLKADPIRGVAIGSTVPDANYDAYMTFNTMKGWFNAPTSDPKKNDKLALGCT